MTPNQALAGITTLAALAALCAGCSNRVPTSIVGDGVLTQLPAVHDLMPQRAADFTADERRRDGADFDPLQPASQAAVSGSSVELTPQVDGSGDSLGDYAFAVYHFVLPGYGDTAEVTLTWDGVADVHERVWVAMANHPAGRWQLFPLPDNGILTLPSMAPYLESDNLWLAVIAGGTAPLSLASILIGDDQFPTADLSANPPGGAAPLMVTLIGSGSSDSDGSIVKYEFDLDGDSTFELDNGSDADVDHSFAFSGSFTVGLRVTDNKGATATDTATVSVDQGQPVDWLHTAGLSKDDRLTSIVADGAGNIYAAGYTTDPTTERSWALLTCWSAAGVYDWGRTWTLNAGHTQNFDVAVDSAGDIITCGWFNNMNPFDQDYDGLILKWSADGDLIWQRRYNGGSNDYLHYACIDGTDIYLAGDTTTFSGNPDDRDALVMRLDSAGSLAWTRRYDWYDDVMMDAKLARSTSGAVALYGLMMDTNRAITDPLQIFPLYFRYSLTGDLEAERCSIESRGIARALAVDYDDADGTTTIYVANTELDTGNSMSLFALSGDGTLIYSRQHIFPTSFSPNCMELSAGGTLVLGGLYGPFDGLLAAFSAASGDFVSAQTPGGTAESNIYDVSMLGEEVLSAGQAKGHEPPWSDVTATSSAPPRLWTAGSGASTTETVTLLDETEFGTVGVWDPTVDSAATDIDGLILRRSL